MEVEREARMKISIDKNLVEFTPENDDETKKLEALWRIMVDCARFNKKMVPVGEYLPGTSEFECPRWFISKGIGQFAMWRPPGTRCANGNLAMNLPPGTKSPNGNRP